MIAAKVRFRDEDGIIHQGELVNEFRILVEMDQEIAAITQPNPTDIDVATFDGLNLVMHRIPMLAVIDMRMEARA